jgi:hypothetical protein
VQTCKPGTPQVRKRWLVGCRADAVPASASPAPAHPKGGAAYRLVCYGDRRGLAGCHQLLGNLICRCAGPKSSSAPVMRLSSAQVIRGIWTRLSTPSMHRRKPDTRSSRARTLRGVEFQGKKKGPEMIRALQFGGVDGLRKRTASLRTREYRNVAKNCGVTWRGLMRLLLRPLAPNRQFDSGWGN